MTEQEILGEFSRILNALLGEDSISLQPNTIRGEINGWDSFQYINFIVAIEAQFGVKFGVADVESFKTVGDIAAELQRLVD